MSKKGSRISCNKVTQVVSTIGNQPVGGMYCPTCTLVMKQPLWLNKAPFEDGTEDPNNQGSAHFLGAPHKKRLARLGILDKARLQEFGKLTEAELDYSKEPYEALKAYVKECGGNPVITVWYFAPPPPGPKVRTIREARRAITSSPFATRTHENKICWLRMACCWDGSGSCARKQTCPYEHVSDPGLFQVVPCQFAGMAGGCRYHREEFHSEGWKIDIFQTSAETEEKTLPYPPDQNYSHKRRLVLGAC